MKTVQVVIKAIKCSKKILLTFFSLLTLVSFSPNSSALSYSFSTYDIDIPGSSMTWLYGVNNKGDFIGSYEFEDQTKTFININGTNHQLGTSSAFGLNNLGSVVGYTYNQQYGQGNTGYILSGGVTNYSRYNGIETSYKDINDNGVAVGYTSEYIRGNNGVILNNGSNELLNYPGARYTILNGINNSGIIVGEYTSAINNLSNGFVYQDGIFTTIVEFGVIKGINNKNQIVGFTQGYSFIYKSGVFDYFQIEGYSTQVNDINDNGIIIGTYFIPGSNGYIPHGFIGRPVLQPDQIPEPSTILLLIAGLAGLAYLRLQKNPLA